VDLREPVEHSLSASRGSQTNTAAIREIDRPLEQTLLHAAIDQFDNSVVFESEGIGSVGNRGRTPGGGARDRQQELVLLWMQACIVSCILTDQQEFPQLMAKRCKGLMERLIWSGRGGSFTHPCIISYYDIIPRTPRE